MKLLIATSPHFFVEENAILEAMFEDGLDYLHLCKPDSDPIFCERLLTLLNKKWHKRILTDDHFYLKDEYNLRGIHISKRHRELPKGYEGVHTRSCFTIEEIDYWKKRCNYVIAEDLDDRLLRIYKDAGVIDNKVFAHQVRSVDDVKKFREAGFGGVVIEDALWDMFDFHQSSDYKGLIEFFRKIHKACG